MAPQDRQNCARMAANTQHDPTQKANGMDPMEYSADPNSLRTQLCTLKCFLTHSFHLPESKGSASSCDFSASQTCSTDPIQTYCTSTSQASNIRYTKVRHAGINSILCSPAGETCRRKASQTTALRLSTQQPAIHPQQPRGQSSVERAL